MNNATILSTKKAIINGKKQDVETLKLLSGKQDIAYRVNGSILTANSFWSLNPKFIN